MELKLIVTFTLATLTMATNTPEAAEPRGPATVPNEATDSTLTVRSEAIDSKAPSDGSAIYHCIRYTIDPQKVADFETYARHWMEGGIIKRCGGEPLGYFLPKKGYGGADNIAITLIGFKNLADYEEYRKKLAADPEARENVEFAKRSGCILVEDRSYFYRVGGEGK